MARKPFFVYPNRSRFPRFTCGVRRETGYTHKTGKTQKSLFLKWGDISPTYDATVQKSLRYLCFSNGLRAPGLEVIKQKLVEDPTLLNQVFWYYRWHDGQVWRPSVARQVVAKSAKGEDVQPFLIRFHHDLFGKDRTHDEKIYYLLLIASMFNKPEIVDVPSFRSVNHTWQITGAWLGREAPFYRFDPSRGVYVLDPTAMETGIAVDAPFQEMLTPATILPPRNYGLEGN